MLKKSLKKKRPGWTNLIGPGPVSFLFRSSMYYRMVTLHNHINPLNVVSTKFFLSRLSQTREVINILNDYENDSQTLPKKYNKITIEIRNLEL